MIGEVHDRDVQVRLEGLFKRPNIVQVAASAEIMRRAGQVRTAARDAGRSLKSPDSVYIATALLHHADALHTFDEKLLHLNGLALVDGLPITKPQGAQTLLQI